MTLQQKWMDRRLEKMKARRDEEWGEDGENVKDGRGLVEAQLPGRQFGQGTRSMS